MDNTTCHHHLQTENSFVVENSFAVGMGSGTENEQDIQILASTAVCMQQQGDYRGYKKSVSGLPS